VYQHPLFDHSDVGAVQKPKRKFCMNKLIASLIVGAFSAAAFATTPVAPVATPATAAPAVAAATAKAEAVPATKAEAAPAAKAESKKVMKEKKAAAKTDATKKVEAAAPAAAVIK
jgi:hypothetical protein